MPGSESPEQRSSFEERLRAARARRGDGDGPQGTGRHMPRGMGLALRLGVEIVSALIVGVGIGWYLDRWLGTAPFLLVLFFFLGAAAGVLNVFRTVSGIGLAPGYRRRDQQGDEDSGGHSGGE
jgi:ATP synthase protein I